MHRENVLVKILGLVHAFVEKLSLPAEVVEFTISHENLIKVEVDEVTILKHISQFVDNVKTFQDQYNTRKIRETEDNADLPASQAAKKMKIDPVEETTDTFHEVDESLIQVTAGKSEIDRRITAFIESKQVEVDLLNKREFCNVVDKGCDDECSCARTDAVFVHRLGQKSHIKVTRIENTSTTSEAQALGQALGSAAPSSLRLTKSCPGIEERLRNIETHFGYKPGRPVPVDVYQRLGCLEERVLQLEGLSPEYFRPNTGSMRLGKASSRRYLNDSTQNLSLDAIDERIRTLRHSLSKGLVPLRF